MAGALDFMKNVYETFGFTYKLKLSTRPEKFLGDIKVWDEAEKGLAESLDSLGLEWKLNPGDGAFYGPKIDITVMDALKRSHQCATIQLDFQLPLRFGLTYVDEKGEKVPPVMIHRAILGSVERMIAILTENFAGKWPFWLSPRQAMVVPVGPHVNSYAMEVKSSLHEAGFCADCDTDDGNTMNKKVRNAQLAQYNYILVVGEKEKENRTVNVRTRDNKVHGELSIDDLLEKFRKLAKERTLKSEEMEGGEPSKSEAKFRTERESSEESEKSESGPKPQSAAGDNISSEKSTSVDSAKFGSILEEAIKAQSQVVDGLNGEEKDQASELLSYLRKELNSLKK